MPSEFAVKDVALEKTARTQGNAMSLTKPILGLAVGGTLGLLDGLSGFLEPSLAPVMSSVITFSLLKGLVSGAAIGYVSEKVHSIALGMLAGIGHRRGPQSSGHPPRGNGVVLGHHATRNVAGRRCRVHDAEIRTAGASAGRCAMNSRS